MELGNAAGKVAESGLSPAVGILFLPLLLPFFYINESLWKEQADELLDLGNKLLRLPSSTDEILLLLEKAESILVKVWQGIPDYKAGALFPLMKALIAEELFRHADLNIQVAVASCLNQITRITAPVFPYPDDQMKEIFQLFMVALKQLLTESGSNFVRAEMILKALATVRSCLMMLDIDIDSMVVEMFQFFLSAIRSNNSDIFKYMGSIMTMIINESDEVSLELLAPLLDSVRKDNKEISPISWELGKTIFEKCGPKLQPYLREAVKTLDLKFDDYAEIISSLCAVTPNGPNMVSESDRVPEANKDDDIPQTKDGNGSDDNNTTENCAEFARPINNSATYDNKVVNCAETAHSEKRVRKANSLMRLEEGYAHIWTRGGQSSSTVPSDNNNEKKLLLPLKPGNGSSLKKPSSGKKAGSGKRGCWSKKEGSNKKTKSEFSSQSNETRDIADKIVESLSPETEETFSRSSVEYGEEMVNVRIMVWWPLDKTFYTGTVEAFDPSTKKHKIKYDDDEEEFLNLREERWELFKERP